MPDFIKKPTLLSAWVAVGLWVLSYGLVKSFSLEGLDIDGAEQVYFAQSWQIGYGTRQPPLYTWLLWWFKPAGVSWVVALEFSRYLCLVVWLAGVQSLARACGADRGVQARVILAHLGLLLVMWRVHDSLTHTVLAAGVTVWGSVALIKALNKPVYWLLVGALAALACLSKLNAALWCVASLLSAWVFILIGQPRVERAPSVMAHLVWMGLGLVIFAALIAPYAHWWLTQPNGSVALARRIVLSDAHQPLWRPLWRVVEGCLEYVLLAPLILFVLANRLRASSSLALVPASPGARWLLWQTGVGLTVLSLALMAMKASHFTPRWLWPVVPGLTVWMCMHSFQAVDASGDHTARPDWRGRVSVMLWVLVLVSVGAAVARWWVPRVNAQRCSNCWSDRPAQLMSADLHARYGQHALRIITGDDHLAGILSQVDERDSTWTASSVDLPPPADFVRDRAPCVAAWVSLEQPKALPDGLRHLAGEFWGTPVFTSSWPMRLAPQRRIWLSSMSLPLSVCDKARQ